MELVKSNNYEILDNVYKSMKPATRETYKTAINQFFGYTNTGINQISELTPNDIKKYIDYLKNKKAYKNATINLKINALKSLFKKASFIFKIPNPFETLSVMNIKTTEPVDKTFSKDKALTSREVKVLLEHYQRRTLSDNQKTVFTANRNYILISLLYYHGLRISEALNVKTSDIEPLNNCYAINITGKGNKPRQIKITSELYQRIRELSAETYIFTTQTGKQFDRINFYNDLKRIGKRILNKDITPHVFRHSFATNLIDKTNNITKVSKYLGHSNINITANYYYHNEMTIDDLNLLKN